MMVFAGCRKVEGPGRFTPGRVYLGRSEVDAGDVVDLGVLTFQDDDGQGVRERSDSGRFEFYSEIYAVCLRDCPAGKLRRGSVVVVTEASRDGMFRVSNVGFCKASWFALLDRTNLLPGMYVRRDSDGLWVRVRAVDGELGIQVEGVDEFLAPTRFRLAVGDGDLLSIPLVRCVDAEGADDLTEGSLYRLMRDSNDMAEVTSDAGTKAVYFFRRFSFDLAGKSRPRGDVVNGEQKPPTEEPKP